MDIGTRLKEARDAQNISLDELQETTKIQKRYLVAIEKGNFHILPGKFYARAFIKEYAIAVGLDPDELLEGHKDEVPTTESQPTVQYSRMQRSGRSSGPGKVPVSFSFIPTVIVVLLVIGIVFVAWSLYQKALTDRSSDPVDKRDDEIIREADPDLNNEQVPDDNDDEAPSEEDSTEDQTDNIEQSTTEFNVIEKGTGSPPESILGVHVPDDEIILTLEADDNVYIEITGDNGASYFKGEFTAEQSPEEFTIQDEKIYFNIGKSTALTLLINGKEVPYPVESVHQKLWLHINNTQP